MGSKKLSKSRLAHATTKSASRVSTREAPHSRNLSGNHSQTIVMIENLGTVITVPSPTSCEVSVGPGDG